ncbi:unnamed protein product [Didymodactylos carnosus]|uniref:Uncharacterized protein n=1 Tax=Didymodactylos carnosus TaxID=1234261 RepID=A0A815BNS8_9BILA|nr:unnamed protein product [Didymodactylos carnosus]CAF1276076.1 unnamed protein product [Didymodactylos carnosus]CAF3916716.1 unnamed protein product [Didymodactylos carnosus]CAF4067623.1 unnamed protein product [Didymodactylos carnosus]
MPDFRHLPEQVHRTFVQRNVRNLKCLNIVEQTESGYEYLPQESNDRIVWQYVIGDELLIQLEHIMRDYRGVLKDTLFARLLLLVKVFSTEFSTTTPTDAFHDYSYTPPPEFILALQNYYVSLLWKFMVYRVGEHEIIQLFHQIIGLSVRCLKFSEGLDRNLVDGVEMQQVLKITQSLLLL